MDALSHFKAMSLSVFTQTYLTFGTGSLAAFMIKFMTLSMIPSPWTENINSLNE